MRCPSCGADNRGGVKFCEDCGTPLTLRCPACGTPATEGKRFCGECGAQLATAQASPPRSEAAIAAPAEAAALVVPGRTSERRLVSVLFADLVGFTSLSQSKDPEEVRELLTRYFEAASSLVERYGGVVEKFIGDAVMAVWGAPVANEDDAERAVRTALDLVEAVAVLGGEVGAPELAARVGVLTGEAAVNLSARGQGMVAGDLVNTASRVQSVAEPGTVLVGDATRRATEAAVAYADAGTSELKGKAEPLPLYRALRVVAGVRGLMKSEGLEPPFVGRERELKVVKELFHACAEDRRAHLIQVSGIAGIGKSRLVWEFFKYMDGLKSLYFWHRGRCLAYGEGVTYWALAEMVRGRAGIVEGEERASSAAKLHRAVEQHLSDAEERRFVEARLAQLIGLEERATADRQELFSAWRLFFERLAETDPVVMVFEDMQWADPSLVEFLDHLLERSRNHPLFVMTLSRPESAAAALSTTLRNSTSLYLDPLSRERMGELLAGFVPGLPGELAERILERAEGVPLYAVETVRMLIDRGLVVRDGARYRPTGPIDSLEVPETLHALIAARLDGLSPAERSVIQDASVLGKTFSRHGLTALTGLSGEALEELLSSLARKEVLSMQSDPRSPEKGQYGFLQDLVRTVAYETLSRRDRKAKHLEAAAYLQDALRNDEDVVEVVASHLLGAYRLDERADDAGELRRRAGAMLRRAGERAASLAAAEEAERYFDQAALLADSALAEAELIERAGQMAELRGHPDAATSRYERATELFSTAGHEHAAARCQARLAGVDFSVGNLERAVERMTTSREAMAGSEPDADLATVAAQLGRLLVLSGRNEEAAPVLEEALQLAEQFELPETYSQALNSKGIMLMNRGRLDESTALLRRALEVALEHDLSSAAMRAYNNLSVALDNQDRFAESEQLVGSAAELGRRVGDRTWELQLRIGGLAVMVALGRWDEAIEIAEETRDSAEARSLGWIYLQLGEVAPILIRRGELEAAAKLMDDLNYEEVDDLQNRFASAVIRAELLRAEGRPAEAVSVAEPVVAGRAMHGLMSQFVKRGLVQAVEAAIEMGDEAKAEELLGVVERARPGELSPWLRAEASRLSARLAARRGDLESAETAFAAAVGGLRQLPLPFDVGVALLEQGEWLAAAGSPAEAGQPAAEAAEIFERLGARPYLERAERLLHAQEVPAGKDTTSVGA
jgi:class 3 adenylate cyclase/tetratricopeptide (TPR) repeat protein